ncbi:Bacterial pre-peptidase c-terminal domain containing protein [Entamoeba marina]
MIIPFLLSLAVFSFAENTQCRTATYVDLTTTPEFQERGDTTHMVSSAFKLGKKTTRQPGRWYHVHTEGLGDIIEIDTCFSEQTNYDSKIMVFGSCSNGMGTKLLTYNDDSVSACGSAARLLFNDRNKRDFYVFVTGSTPNDVGIFGLRINKQYPHSNTVCTESLPITLPAIREGTTTAIVPNLNGLSGLFYTIRGTGERIHISTCHRATNVETVITVIDNCNNPSPLPIQNEPCQNQMLGSMAHIDSVAGKNYIIHISSSLKRRGMYVAFFESESMVNPGTCDQAQAITNIPFSSTTKTEGSVQTMSCGNTLQNRGSWYSIVGDGYDYIFHTCNSMNGPQDSTMIEIFETCNSNSKCEMNNNGCGLHGKITKHLEVGKNYFIKVSCSNPHTNCRVTLSVDKLSTQGDVNSCIFAKPIHIDKEDDVFTDSFDITNARKSRIHCGGDSEQHGVWYKVINDYKKPFPVFIQAHVLLASASKHTAEIQMYRTCSLECEEHQQSIAHVTLKPKETVMFFITAAESEGQISLYLRRDHTLLHDTCKTALELNAPFSLVEYKPNTGAVTTPICAGEQVGRHTGIYYYFQSTVTDTMIVETCGLETQFDTYVEVFMGCGKDASCVLSNDDSPECGSLASYVRFEAQQGAEYYIYVSEASKAIDTEGTFRLNVYTLNPPEHSTCERAESLTPGLFQHALTKYAFDSVSNCKLNTHHDLQSLLYGKVSKKKESVEHLKGLWYKYTATVNGKIHVNTCNAGTSVRTRIGVYKTCAVMSGVSVPDQCITENSVSYQSCSTRGTHVSVDMSSGETLFFFIGGETPNDVGFIAVESEFQTIDKSYKRVKFGPRVGPRRIKERRSRWVLWGAIWFVYAAICVVVFLGLQVFGKKDDFLGYHEL